MDSVLRTEMGDRIFLLKTAPKSALKPIQPIEDTPKRAPQRTKRVHWYTLMAWWCPPTSLG